MEPSSIGLVKSKVVGSAFTLDGDRFTLVSNRLESLGLGIEEEVLSVGLLSWVNDQVGSSDGNNSSHWQ